MRPVTVVTGASSGLGSGLAPLFAADGDTVVLAARRLEKIEALAEQIRAAGGQAVALQLDVGDRAAVRDAFEHIEQEVGPIHTLIANAGVGDQTPAIDFDAETVEWIHRVNFLGVVYCIEAALPAMLERRAGHVVAVSSLTAYRGLPGASAYCASKAAVNSLMQGLRIELRREGIAATTLCPGFVRTELTARNRVPMPFILDLDDAARRMHRAVRKKRREYAFPFPLSAITRWSRWLPNWLYDLVLRNVQHKKAPPAEPEPRA